MPYVPQSNGTAERLNRTITDIAIPILHQSGLPRNCWPYAVEVACYLYNRTPVAGKDLTPVELMFNQKPNLSHLRPFGCRAYVHKPQIQRTSKFDDRAIEGIMIGYPSDGKGYLILTPDNKIISSSGAQISAKNSALASGRPSSTARVRLPETRSVSMSRMLFTTSTALA